MIGCEATYNAHGQALLVAYTDHIFSTVLCERIPVGQHEGEVRGMICSYRREIETGRS